MANKNSSNLKRGLCIGAVVLLVLAIVGSIIGLWYKVDKMRGPEELSGAAYSIGLLDESGDYQKGDTAIYTRKAITVKGLTCTLAKDAKITYQLFFYDAKDKFISASGELSEDFDGTDIPKNAESVKIVITPTEDEDGKVSLVEVLGYAKQLTVTVNR